MYELFHLSYSSHEEVLFRNADDYIFAGNSLAVATHDSKSRLLCHSLMSDHVHILLLSEKPTDFIRRLRISTSKHFNNKYLRKGRLGEKYFFCSKVEGNYHVIAAASYILRNPVHHGICTLPFRYPFSSINSYFRKDIFKNNTDVIQNKIPHCPNNIPRKFIPHNKIIPDGYQVSSQGIILPENYLETSFLEGYYITPRRFMYYMTRISDNEWQREQEKDESQSTPITLNEIEDRNRFSISKLLTNEKGHFKPVDYDDLFICNYIDTSMVPRYRKKSYTHLSFQEKNEIAQTLRNKFHISDKQVIRCLALTAK